MTEQLDFRSEWLMKSCKPEESSSISEQSRLPLEAGHQPGEPGMSLTSIAAPHRPSVSVYQFDPVRTCPSFFSRSLAARSELHAEQESETSMNQVALRMADDAEREISRLEHELATIKRQILAQRSAIVFGASPNVRAILRARRMRDELINRELFADPAWDILLELYGADLDQKRMSTSELCIAAAVPATTALRWIEKLDQMNFLARQKDPLDGRRIWVALTPVARLKLESYFDALAATSDFGHSM